MNLHTLNLQANHTAILAWSVEGFHSSRPSGEGLAQMGLQTTFNLSSLSNRTEPHMILIQHGPYYFKRAV